MSRSILECRDAYQLVHSNTNHVLGNHDGPGKTKLAGETVDGGKHEVGQRTQRPSRSCLASGELLAGILEGNKEKMGAKHTGMDIFMMGL